MAARDDGPSAGLGSPDEFADALDGHGREAVLLQPGEYLGALDMGHDCGNVPGTGLAHQRLYGPELGLVGGDVTAEAGASSTLAEQLVHFVEVAPPQVVPLLGDDDLVGASTGKLAHGAQHLIGPIPGRPQPEADNAPAMAAAASSEQGATHL